MIGTWHHLVRGPWSVSAAAFRPLLKKGPFWRCAVANKPCVDIEGPCRETLQLMPEGTAQLMYLLFGASLIIFGIGFWSKIQAWRRGGNEVAWDQPGQRLRRLLHYGLFQAKTAKKRYAGPMHQLIFWGFLVLFIGTVLVLIEYDFTLALFNYQFLVGNFYLFFEFMLDLFGVLFLIGLAMAIRRRMGDSKETFTRKPVQDWWILGSLTLLGIQGFLVEGLRLSIRQPEWAGFSFVGNALASGFSVIDPGTQLGLYRFLWWFHAITLFAWVATIPYTKMQHILVSPANIFFGQVDTTVHRGELSKPFDLQQALETGDLDITMGAQKLQDFTWRQLLSLDACTECGRCTDVCPAYAAGRPLSPMKLVLDLRDEMHRQTGRAWKGAIESNGQFHPAATKNGSPTPQAPAGNQLVDSVINNQTLWSCVTCRACMEECPVMIEHVPLIVDMRRGLVMESRLDGHQTRLLNNLANTGNAYGFPTADRANWSQGLEVPHMKEVGNAKDLEVLYWVGCSGSYDQRNQKVSRALVKIFKAAKVKFAILGSEERCTGDPARRLGEESRFQEMVITNAEVLKKYNVTRVVAQCPHCFNTLQNEYKKFGVHLDVVHHTQFIDELVNQGRLKLHKSIRDRIAYHDPCYLGRYNGVYEAPRRTLQLLQIGDEPVEIHRHRDKAFCCGAGGSNMWYEVKDERERISNIRYKEAKETGAKKLATGCPFCMTMFDDANRVIGEESMQVQDVAEIVAEALDASRPDAPA